MSTFGLRADSEVPDQVPGPKADQQRYDHQFGHQTNQETLSHSERLRDAAIEAKRKAYCTYSRCIAVRAYQLPLIEVMRPLSFPPSIKSSSANLLSIRFRPGSPDPLSYVQNLRSLFAFPRRRRRSDHDARICRTGNYLRLQYRECQLSRRRVRRAMCPRHGRCESLFVLTSYLKSLAPKGCWWLSERLLNMRQAAGSTRGYTAIAVATDTETPTSPCGMCRQFLREFCRMDLPVLMYCRAADSELTPPTVDGGQPDIKTLGEVGLNQLHPCVLHSCLLPRE